MDATTFTIIKINFAQITFNTFKSFLRISNLHKLSREEILRMENLLLILLQTLDKLFIALRNTPRNEDYHKVASELYGLVFYFRRHLVNCLLYIKDITK